MKTILIIDDTDTLRSDLHEVLVFEDFAVIEAENGIIGVQRA